MAMEIHVFFRGKLPSKAALGRTMKELGFPLWVKPATGPLEGHSGYLPMRLEREDYDEKGTDRRVQGVGKIIETWQGWAKAIPDSKATFVREFASGDTAVFELVWKG